MIRARLAEVFPDTSAYAPLTRDELQITEKTLLESCTEQRHPLRKADSQSATLNGTDADPVDIANWLAGLPVDLDARVIVIWRGERSAVRMSYRAFIQHYDDLWYPGADDLWVYGEMDHWLLGIDHEERFEFTRCLDG